MQKKTFDLICSVSELTGLFQKKTNIRGLLQVVVKLIAKHMQTEACAIFLYDDKNEELVLRATEGLNQDMVGKLKLKIGEGITGTALKELRSINVARGTQDPNFMHVPGIHEEQYESFLAVPILHSSTKLGVIVLEDSRPGYYTKWDARALSAIASQLASFLENAKVLLEMRSQVLQRNDNSLDNKLHHQDPIISQDISPHDHNSQGYTADGLLKYQGVSLSSQQNNTLKTFFKGKAAVEGIAFGRAFLISSSTGQTYLQPEEGPYHETEEAFEKALDKSKNQLEQLQQHMEMKLSEMGSLIFGSHLLMLSDDAFSGSIREHIQQGMLPSKAIIKVVNEYIDIFYSSESRVIREKIHDVRDLGHRLLKNLITIEEDDGDYYGQIIVAKDLLPSELVKLAVQHAEGFILYGIRPTGHIAILARSIGVPVLFINDLSFFSQYVNRLLIVDAYQGTLLVDPDDTVVEKYVTLIEDERKIKADQKAGRKNRIAAVQTKDKKPISLSANINLVSDIKQLQQINIKGIGLYRSEFMYLIRNNFPSEEEQYIIYLRLLKEMKKVVFRTLDIGGDKVLSILENLHEPNPLLGMRAIRYSLNNISTFKEQIRALLRAGYRKELNILFPLVPGLDEFLQLKQITQEAVKSLEAEKISHNKKPKFGIMVELPSCVFCIEELAKEADFLSIGTNDLVQYILGVDRNNEQVQDFYIPYHPSVLYAIHSVVKAGLNNNCPISVCGEAVSDPAMLTFFIGIGLRDFSVDPRLLFTVKEKIGETDMHEAQQTAEDMLNCKSVAEIEKLLVNQGLHNSV